MDDGWGWIAFTAIGCFCGTLRVRPAGMCASEATRFAALHMPISMGLSEAVMPPTSAGIGAYWLALRMDHGSQ